MTTAVAITILLTALGLAASFGVGHTLGSKAAAALPVVNIHTGHIALDNAINSIGNASEDILKAELNGPLMDDLLKAASSGSLVSVEQVLAKEVPGLVDQVLAHLGPVAGPLVKAALGGDLRSKVETVLKGRALAVAAEQNKAIITLASGTRVVTPAPAGS